MNSESSKAFSEGTSAKQRHGQDEQLTFDLFDRPSTTIDLFASYFTTQAHIPPRQPIRRLRNGHAHTSSCNHPPYPSSSTPPYSKNLTHGPPFNLAIHSQQIPLIQLYVSGLLLRCKKLQFLNYFHNSAVISVLRVAEWCLGHVRQCGGYERKFMERTVSGAHWVEQKHGLVEGVLGNVTFYYLLNFCLKVVW